MTSTEVGIISLIKSAIKSVPVTLPADFDWEEAKRIIRSHEIYGLIYYGLKNSHIDIPQWLKDKILQRTAFLTRLTHAANTVMKAFDDEEIEYVPLKGLITKDAYPQKIMRHMSDADILIHEKDYEKKIKPIMLKLGFAEGVESDHELHWSKEDLMIELHKRIIPSYNKDYYKVIGDGWEWIKEHDNFEYTFIHFAKHYRDAGVGIGHLVDLEVLWEEKDFSYIGLNEFRENIRKTLDVWFHDGEPDEKTDLITTTVFESGEYGTSENRESSGDIKVLNSAKGNPFLANIKNKLRMLFIPYSSYKAAFPILNKLPILLPVFFLWRMIRAPFRKSGRRNLTKVVKSQDEYAGKLQAVGLEYKF